MDEYKDTTQQAQEEQEVQEGTKLDFPFIVEITAASLADTHTIEDAEKKLSDPSFIADMPQIVGYVISTIRKEIEENPQFRRETAPFYDVYQKLPGYDPALDPESEAFNADAYTAAIDAFPFDEFFRQVTLAWAEMVDEQKQIRELMPDIAGLAYEVQKVIHGALTVTQSDDFIKALQRQINLAKKKASEPGIPTVLSEKQMLSLKSKVVDVFSRVRFSDTAKGVVTINIDDKEYKFTFTNFNKLKGTSGISTHKLLRVALAQFTQNNHYGTKSGIKYRVDIPLKEYARKLNYEIDEDPTAEDPKKEKNRANGEMRNARKRIRQDLDILFACRVEWQEVVQGKAGNFEKCQFFDRVSIHNGIITLDFGRYISDNYLSLLPLTYYPLALLSIDGRNENAYQIGLAMADHYNNIYNHIGTGNPSLLSVKTLLDKTSLPTIEAIRKNRRSWEERIKEPFETALDKLYQAGVISDWKYSKAKNEDLTNDEAAQINSYEAFSSLFIHYQIKDPADLNDAIEKKQAQIAARADIKKSRDKTNKKG